MNLDRNAQSLDRLRRTMQKIAAGGVGGSTSLGDTSLIYVSTNLLELNKYSTLIPQDSFSVAASTTVNLSTTTSYSFGLTSYLASTGPSTNEGANALFAQFRRFFASTGFNSTSLWQGSTLICSTSTSGSSVAPAQDTFLLSTSGSTVSVLVNGVTQLISTFTVPTGTPYSGFFFPLSNDWGTGSVRLNAWEIFVHGTPVFIDIFPGSYSQVASLVADNSTYQSRLSTGLSLTAFQPIYNTYNNGNSSSDNTAFSTNGLYYNGASQTAEGLLYARNWSGQSTGLNGLIVYPSTGSTQLGGVAVNVDNVTIGINGLNQLHTLGSAGSVTSVDVSLPSTVFSTSNGPITSSGIITIPFQTQADNLILAGPSTGAVAAPVFRRLVGADVGFTTKGDILTQLSTGLLTRVGIGTDGQVLMAASSTTSGLLWTTPLSGTVTSVALALPVSVFTISGSPVTTSGTLTGAFATQVSTTFFAGPTSGVAANPTFRGIGQFDLGLLSTGDLLSITSTGMARLSKGTVGQVLRVSTNQPTNLIWDNLGMSTKGDIVVLASTGVISILPAGTTNQFLIVSSTSSTGLQWVDLGSSTILGSVLPLSTAGPDHDGGAIYRTDTGSPSIQVRGNQETFARSLMAVGGVSTTHATPVAIASFSTVFPGNYLSTGKMVEFRMMLNYAVSANNTTSFLISTSTQAGASQAFALSGVIFGGSLVWDVGGSIGLTSLGSTSSSPIRIGVMGYTPFASGANMFWTSTITLDVTAPWVFIVGFSTTNSNAGTVSTSTTYAYGLGLN